MEYFGELKEMSKICVVLVPINQLTRQMDPSFSCVASFSFTSQWIYLYYLSTSESKQRLTLLLNSNIFKKMVHEIYIINTHQ